MILALFSGILYCQNRKELKDQKAKEEGEQYEVTRMLLDSGSFEFNAEWATSFQGVRVNLVTNPNYLRIDPEKASIYLPYLGVAHTSNEAFSSTGGIVFEGRLENYQLKANDKKKQFNLRFRCRAQSEILDFDMLVYANGSARVNANSSTRTSVKYLGKIKAGDSGEQ